MHTSVEERKIFVSEKKNVSGSGSESGRSGRILRRLSNGVVVSTEVLLERFNIIIHVCFEYRDCLGFPSNTI